MSIKINKSNVINHPIKINGLYIYIYIYIHPKKWSTFLGGSPWLPPRLFHRQQLLHRALPLRPLLQQLPDGLRQAPPTAQLGAARGHAAVVLGGPAEVLHEERHVLPGKNGRKSWVNMIIHGIDGSFIDGLPIKNGDFPWLQSGAP